MRNLKISLIVILGVIILGLCRIMAWGMEYGNRGGRFFSVGETYSDMQVVLDKEISLDGISNIEILYSENSNDVFFYESEGDTLVVKEYANYELEEKEVSTVAITEDTIEIKGQRRNQQNLFFGGPYGFGYSSTGWGYTQIGLPASYKGNLTVQTIGGDIRSDCDLNIDGSFIASSISGDMMLPTLSAKSVTLTSTSGDLNTGKKISITSNGTGEITISTTSGDVHAEFLSGKTTITSTSGDISVEKMDGDVSVSTTSGDVKILDGSGRRSIYTSSGQIIMKNIDDFFDINGSSAEVVVEAKRGEGKVVTSSGDVRVELSQLTGNLEIETVSGEVVTCLSNDSSFEFKADTTSGDINTFFDDDLSFSKKGNSAQGSVGTMEPGYMVQIHTISGDVRVTEQ